uniref:Uncharacterized protein n=1 Tax=viral metagenome TaxID=1070528 RepID=A0A6C0C7Y9_9ZZZZ
MDRSPRKQVYQEFYRREDYAETLKRLPEVVKKAEIQSLKVIEPTIYEQSEIMNLVREFVKSKKRKIYGGTAINELIKIKNPSETIYDEFTFGDIDFYSPEPKVDIVELCDFLYNKNKYKNINANEAQHEETYRVYVNWQLYCNITYVPKHIYTKIKSVEIDELLYVDPHFIWIDQLRIYNNPMLCSRLWEKTFKREFLLLKNYPLEEFENRFEIPKPSMEINGYHIKIKQEFLKGDPNVLINGYDAYNFYVRYGTDSGMECNLPFLELSSVNYVETVIKLFTYVRKMVINVDNVGISEYTPFFQFVGHTVMITYNNIPLVSVSDVSCTCVPTIDVSSGIKYAAYQYLLMSLLINKFRIFLTGDRVMYKNYGTAVSNLVKVKNNYLKQNKLNVINNSPFGEFRTSCVGTPVSPTRLYLARRSERKENGKRVEFTYTPDNFFKMPDEARQKFDPKRAKYNNTSGNVIVQPEKMRFYFDGEKLTERAQDAEEEQN